MEHIVLRDSPNPYSPLGHCACFLLLVNRSATKYCHLRFDLLASFEQAMIRRQPQPTTDIVLAGSVTRILEYLRYAING